MDEEIEFVQALQMEGTKKDKVINQVYKQLNTGSFCFSP